MIALVQIDLSTITVLPFGRSSSRLSKVAHLRTVDTLITTQVLWRFRLFSGFGEQVETATVEIDRMNEVLPVAEASCGVLHPLDFGVDRFAAGVGNPVSQIRNDVLEPTVEHPRHFDHRLESASYSPSMPPAGMLSRRSFVDVIV